MLDRDGVVNENRHDYVKAWEEVRFLPGVFAALAHLAAARYPVVLVTNQSVVGRGILTTAQVEDLNRRIVQEIEAHGGRIDAVYYCPHHPAAGCDCRKPRPGLFYQAARELDLDLTRSYLVGDAGSDIEAALAAGATPILVLTGRGRAQHPLVLERVNPPPVVLPDLPAAVDYILAHPL